MRGNGLNFETKKRVVSDTNRSMKKICGLYGAYFSIVVSAQNRYQMVVQYQQRRYKRL